MTIVSSSVSSLFSLCKWRQKNYSHHLHHLTTWIIFIRCLIRPIDHRKRDTNLKLFASLVVKDGDYSYNPGSEFKKIKNCLMPANYRYGQVADCRVEVKQFIKENCNFVRGFSAPFLDRLRNNSDVAVFRGLAVIADNSINYRIRIGSTRRGECVTFHFSVEATDSTPEENRTRDVQKQWTQRV